MNLERRRGDEKSEEDHPAGNRSDAVFRHVGILQRGVGADADVAVLRSSTAVVGCRPRAKAKLMENTWVFFCSFPGPKRAVTGHLRKSGHARAQVFGDWRRGVRSIHHVS